MVVYLGKATPASGQGGGGSGTVDQTYDPTSTNAQSGTAVAEALATVTVATDNSTISKNESNELQAIGLKEARTDTAIRLWHGTEEQWEQGVSQTWYNWINQNPTWASDEYSMPDSNNWGYVKYGNGKLVVVAGLVYTDNVTYSEDDGETWSTSSMPTGHNTRWNAFAFGDGHFVSIGYNSNVAAYSADGNTWNEVTLPATERWFSLGYGNGRFIAVTQLGSATIYSTDGGESWSEGGNASFGNNTQSSIVYGDGKFIAIGGVNTSSNQTYYTTDGGENWTAGTMSSSQTWMSAAYGNNKFVAVAKGTDTYAYSSDGITWTDGTLPSSANWMSVTFGNGKFVAVADNGKYAYSSDGLTWTEDTFTGTGWNSVTYGNNKYFAITLSTHLAAQLAEDAGSYFTSEAEPTTASTVYSAPNTASALTITAVGTGTITLSDTNTYAYNSAGNQTTYQSVGEAYPNYLCFIDGVGVKMGTTSIVTVDQTYNASSTNAQSGVAVDSVVGNIETALQGV